MSCLLLPLSQEDPGRSKVEEKNRRQNPRILHLLEGACASNPEQDSEKLEEKQEEEKHNDNGSHEEDEEGGEDGGEDPINT